MMEEVTLRGVIMQTAGTAAFASPDGSGSIVFDAASHRVLGMVIGSFDALVITMTVAELQEKIGSDYTIA